MNKVQSYILNLLPPHRQRKNGWYYFNAVCCGHVESDDTKSRGNLMLTDDGGFIYSCFNCRFKCGWSPSHHMSSKVRQLLKDLGCNSKQIMEVNQLIDEINGLNPNDVKSVDAPKPRIYRDIPSGYKSIKQSLLEGEKSDTFIKVMEYLNLRNPRLIEFYDLMWKKGVNSILIPCYEFGRVVGYSMRSLDDNSKSKYIHYIPSGYLFNFDNLLKDRKYIVLVEGQMDAISIDGVAVLSNVLTEDKLKRLLNYSKDKEIIILPDRDKPGKKLVEQILKLKLSFGVSFPNWDKSIKDAEDAVIKYGRLYTIYSILNNVEKDPDKIKLKLKMESY